MIGSEINEIKQSYYDPFQIGIDWSSQIWDASL